MADIIAFTPREPDVMAGASAPIYSVDIGGTAVRYFIPPGDTPSLPWCPIEDIGMAMGLTAEATKDLTLQVVSRWFPWLKAVETDGGKRVLLPLLGVTALLIELKAGAVEPEIMDGAAAAMDLSLASVSPSERFQAMIIAARAASSPGEMSSLTAEAVA